MPASDLAQMLAELDRDFLPHISMNAVVFGARGGRLEVLLMRWFGMEVWGLPAGYVRKDEDLEEAAARMVREQTHLEGVFLKQFQTFGRTNRGEGDFAELLRARGIDAPADHWAFGRVVSIGYVALVDATRARVVPDAMADEARWWEVGALPRLAFDHDEMVERALGALRAGIDELPLGATLLPGEFTMPELQRLYETVLGRSLDRRNFQNRMLGQGLVERLPEPRPSRVSRPTYLYRWVGRGAGGANGSEPVGAGAGRPRSA
ncbi:MAG TPA: NUDIX domain-containing protein [Longimicrobiales bacterium]